LEQMSAGDDAAMGKTLDLGLLDWMMATRIAVLPLWGIVWSSHWLAVVSRWSGVSSPALMTVGLGGVASWRLDGGCC
jgi:hypothetical protein